MTRSSICFVVEWNNRKLTTLFFNEPTHPRPTPDPSQERSVCPRRVSSTPGRGKGWVHSPDAYKKTKEALAMNDASPSCRLTRREYLGQTASGVAAATVAGSALGSSIAHAVESSEKVI